MNGVADRLRCISHDSNHGSWRMAFLSPERRFAPFVSRINAYAEWGTGFARRRELPSGLATLVFNLGDDLRVEHPLGTQATFRAGAAFYSGLSETYAVTETDRAQQGAQVMLTPLGARRLLGFPLAEVGDRLIDPADLFGPSAHEAVERLQAANAAPRRLAILENEITGRLAASPNCVPRDLAWAAHRLQSTCGRIGVAALADELECSRKHLTVRFRREFGMTPKRLGRVLRFARAIAVLRTDRVASWAELADQCGYADQSHMSRDFHDFAGGPPAAFLRRKLPDEGGFVD